MFWRTRRWLSSLLLAFIAFTLTFVQVACSRTSQAEQLSPEQIIALQAKPAVVRISTGCYASFKYTEKDDAGKPRETNYYDFGYGGPGSGFFVNSNGYIATYAVLDADDCKKQLYRNLALEVDRRDDIEGVQRDSEISGFEYINNVYLPHPEAKNPFKFRIERSGAPLGEGKDIAIIKIEVDDAPVLKLGDSKEVQLREQIGIIGYPIVADNANSLDSYKQVLSDQSLVEASVTEGRISNPNKILKDNSPVLQLDALAVYGSAGSPVLNSQGQVIGLVAPAEIDRNPFFNGDKSRLAERGIPIAIPANSIKEFVQSAGLKNEEGRTDTLFQEGLKSFLAGDYQTAKNKFEAVKELFREHSEVDRLIGRSNELLVDQEPPYAMMGAIAGAVLGLFALVAFLLMRKAGAKKRKKAAVPVTAYQDVNGNGSRPTGVELQPYIELEFQGQTLSLILQRDEHRIGRDSSWSDVQIPDNWEVISRHHATVRKEGNSYRIYDGDGKMTSSNGLLRKDNTKVDASGHLLQHEEELRIGKNPREQVVLTYFNPSSSRINARPTRMADY